MPRLETLLPELSPEEEALRLGVQNVVSPIVDQLRALEVADHTEWAQTASALEVFALARRAEEEGLSLPDKLRSALTDRLSWKQHYENYKYGYLFAIRRGKPGIRKYYAGWRVYCHLAASNIRYLLELVDQALDRHFAEGRGPGEPVGQDIQTRVAQDTGQRNLRELEGLSLNGPKLTRLLLGLGRIFQVLAADPVGHTPEVNQFTLAADVEDPTVRMEVAELLTDGIMNLALVRHVGSKLQEQTDIRQFDYAVHSIFASFFSYSYRRKRKIRLRDRDLLELVSQPTVAIERVVESQNRALESDPLDELPEQMALFGDFYASSSE